MIFPLYCLFFKIIFWICCSAACLLVLILWRIGELYGIMNNCTIDLRNIFETLKCRLWNQSWKVIIDSLSFPMSVLEVRGVQQDSHICFCAFAHDFQSWVSFSGLLLFRSAGGRETYSSHRSQNAVFMSHGFWLFSSENSDFFEACRLANHPWNQPHVKVHGFVGWSKSW